jgi:hypothetical protein
LTWFLDANVGLAVTYHIEVSDLLSVVFLLSKLQFWKISGISECGARRPANDLW